MKAQHDDNLGSWLLLMHVKIEDTSVGESEVTFFDHQVKCHLLTTCLTTQK